MDEKMAWNPIQPTIYDHSKNQARQPQEVLLLNF